MEFFYNVTVTPGQPPAGKSHNIVGFPSRLGPFGVSTLSFAYTEPPANHQLQFRLFYSGTSLHCCFYWQACVPVSQDSLYLLPYKLQIFFSISVKNVIDILKEIALHLQIAFGRMDILTILIFPFHKCRASFHLFVSSSISFISFIVFIYRSPKSFPRKTIARRQSVCLRRSYKQLRN